MTLQDPVQRQAEEDILKLIHAVSVNFQEQLDVEHLQEVVESIKHERVTEFIYLFIKDHKYQRLGALSTAIDRLRDAQALEDKKKPTKKKVVKNRKGLQ